MRPLIRKEIRLLLPFWVLAMLLAVLPEWIFPAEKLWRGDIFWFFAFGMMLLGLVPFGQEFGLGTFSALLAQPVARRRIWRTKISLVLLGAVMVLIAFIFSHHARFDLGIKEDIESLIGQQRQGFIQNLNVHEWELNAKKEQTAEFWTAPITSLLLLLVGVSGGLWATLLFRQTGAAIWFVILIPAVLYVVVEGVFSSFPGQVADKVADIVLTVVLGVYSATGFIWAHRLFARAQDSQWLGENIPLLSLSPAKAQTDSAAPRRRSAVRALVRKEFQSHQISLIIAFGLLVLHVCTLIIRGVFTMPRTPELRFAIQAVPLLWLLVPWLIGSVTVAEERKLGTMESQLCLPVTRRVQFTIKLCVALLLGIVLGGLMPCLIEGLGTLAGVPSEIVVSRLSPGGTTFFATVLDMIIAAAAIGILSLFASTLTRNTLHALGGAIAFGAAFSGLFQWLLVESIQQDYSFWRGPLIVFTVITVSLVTILCLSFWNYKILHAGRRVWLRNLLILCGALVFTGIATAVVYQRPWELAMSVEPRHGPARLSGPVRPTLAMSRFRVFALLPDGQLWATADYHWKELKGYEEVWNSTFKTNTMERRRVPIPATGMFIGGSNWVSVAASDGYIGACALQADGTLWKIFSGNKMTNSWHLAIWLALNPEPQRIGSDSDWKSIAVSNGRFLAVKTNGTLWGWGDNQDGRLGVDLPKRIKEPVQIGTDSDWAGFFGEGYRTVIMKSNGEIWDWEEITDEHHLKLVPRHMNGADWAAADVGYQDFLVIRQDGSLWDRPTSHAPERVFGKDLPDREGYGFLRIGNDSDWVRVCGNRPYLFGLKKDGRLIKSGTELFSSALGQPSKYADWIAIDAPEWAEPIALASDGTICFWEDTRDWRSVSGRLLAPTHRPLWSLNIFTGSQK